MYNKRYIVNSVNSVSKKRKVDYYLSATTNKYFQNADILGYYLKLYNINTVDDLIKFTIYNNNGIFISTPCIENEINKYIFDKGNQYELLVIEKIKELSKINNLSFEQIVLDSPPVYDKYNSYLDNTKKAINSKVDIIFQGMIQTKNIQDKFRGFPDLIVSNRAFKQLFFNFVDKNDNCNLKLNLDDCYEYIVIDIKSSTIMLNIDGLTARNIDIVKIYKSQLAVYGKIMENNFKKKCLTYILPHTLLIEYSVNGIKHNKKIVNSMVDKFCVTCVDIHNKDQEYLDNLKLNYSSFKKCLDNFTDEKFTMKFLSDIQIDTLKKSSAQELNSFNGIKCKKLLPAVEDNTGHIPFVKGNYIDRLDVKKWIAYQTRSLSLLRGLNSTDLINLQKQGIVSYLQMDKILDWCKVNKKKEYTIIESIVKANNSDTILYCKDKCSKISDFNKILDKKYVCCLDFETIPIKLINANNTNISIENLDENHGQKIFMIGLTIYKVEDKKLIYMLDKQYILEDINSGPLSAKANQLDIDIYTMFIDLKSDVENYLDDADKRDICFVIWSSFETLVMKSSIYIKEMYKENLLFGIEIIDLMKLFTDNNPIGVKGAFDYSIKSIALGYLNNGLLSEDKFWDKNEISNGLDAMFYSLWYYFDKKKYEDIFENIKKYNIIDCRIMADIINITYQQI
jgi:hypothetical protein